MNFFSSAPKPIITFKLRAKKGRQKKVVAVDDVANVVAVPVGAPRTRELCVYVKDENIGGEVELIYPAQGFEHLGIQIELLGQIETNAVKPGSKSTSTTKSKPKIHQFLTQMQMLSPPNLLERNKTYNFGFNFMAEQFQKPFDSYNGSNAKIRYFLRFTINAKSTYYKSVKEEDIWVVKTDVNEDEARLNEKKGDDLLVLSNLERLRTNPECLKKFVKMEVGIEDCLHIEFEFNKSRFHLSDVIIGSIKFLLIRVRIKSMELGIIRREEILDGNESSNSSDTLGKFEIMSGAPVKDEVIPVRVFLNALSYSKDFIPDDVNYSSKLTPTYSAEQAGGKFNVKYFLNLVLLDETDRRYFKQQEIEMFRLD